MGLINAIRKGQLAKHLLSADAESLADPRWWKRLYELLWGVKEIREMLKGYKTYLVAALTAAVVLAHSLGYIDAATRDTLLGLLGAGALGTVRSALKDIRRG